MSTLILKIATVPCLDAGRAIYKLGDLSGDGIYKAMMHLQHQKNGTEFLPLNQHKIVSISVVTLDGKCIASQTLGDESSEESDLLNQLAEYLASADDVVCWNGAEFDLSVIGYRFLKYGIACAAFWNRDSFEESSVQTLDLIDVLSGYTPSAVESLSEMAQVLGLAGDIGLQSLDVLEQYQQGNLQAIRQACEVDALNTYLIYLKFQKTRADIPAADYDTLNLQLKQQMAASDLPHHKQFATASWAEKQ